MSGDRDLSRSFFLIKKDTPQSELLFKIVLNQNTSASGHKMRCQKMESIVTVSVIKIMAAGIAYLRSLKKKENNG
jgi:hypothetical protein